MLIHNCLIQLQCKKTWCICFKLRDRVLRVKLYSLRTTECMWGVKLPISSYFPNLISYTKHKQPFLKPILVVVVLGWTKHQQRFVPDLVNLVFQISILLIQSASGRQPLNNWTVHVWRRQWCQFDYLIRCGASCLLVKSRQGFTELFFPPLHHWGNSAQEEKMSKYFIIGSCLVQIIIDS